MTQIRRKRTFISFDFDNDEELKDALIGQARNDDSPFEVADWSLQEAQKEQEWKARARERINRAEVVVVICGTQTHRAPGASAELAMAQQLKKPYFLLKGRPEKQCYKPSSSKATDKIYNWTWKNLQALFAGQR